MGLDKQTSRPTLGNSEAATFSKKKPVFDPSIPRSLQLSSSALMKRAARESRGLWETDLSQGLYLLVDIVREYDRMTSVYPLGLYASAATARKFERPDVTDADQGHQHQLYV